MTTVEARIDGKWVPIFSSRHQKWAEQAFATYRRVCRWKIRMRRKP